jgi:hypothetical protein
MFNVNNNFCIIQYRKQNTVNIFEHINILGYTTIVSRYININNSFIILERIKSVLLGI